jgi:poly-gamma-glutamate biosynthesis protein PgsC/CapC
MLFYERVQLTTGGAIVPAYLALGLLAPLTVLLTVLASYATWALVNQVIAKRRILYGRRKFEIELLAGLGVVALVLGIRMAAGQLSDAAFMVSTIGFLVPGIIAHDMARQGPRKTTYAIVATVAIVAAFLYLYVTLLRLAGADVAPAADLASVLGYDRRLMLVAIAVSVLLSMLIFGRRGLRTGGFVTGAYVAFMLPRWADLLFVAGVAVLTWFVVARLLMPRLLLFGRRKLSTMVLFGALIGWSAELVVHWLTGGLYEPGRGLTVMTLMIPALLANDAQRQGWERTAWGTALATAGVYGAVNLIAAGLSLLGLL